jgi:DNA-binding LacI/PurR family transcriptional regulator
MTRITLTDVARSLGLSTTTVSRALAGYPDVAEETRERVIAAVEALGYVPNRQAQQLRRQRAGAVGLVTLTDRGISYRLVRTQGAKPLPGHLLAALLALLALALIPLRAGRG